MTNEKKRRIRFFGFHKGAHLDEHEMRDMALMAGWSRWYWPREQPPELVVFDSDEDILRRAAKNEDIVFLGCGGEIKDRLAGEVVDEHTAEGRESNTCGAVLMAKLLGIDQKPEWQKIIAEVLRSDTTADQRQLELGQLIKVLYGWGRDASEERVGRFVHTVTNALRREARGDAPRHQPTPALSVKLGKVAKIENMIDQVKRIVLPAFSPLPILFVAFMAMRKASDQSQVRLVASQEELAKYAARFKEQRDVLFIGIEGGQIPPQMSVKKAAEHLQLDRAHGFRTIIAELQRYEREEQRLFELGHLVDALNAHTESEPQHVYERVAWIFGALVRRAHELFVDCPEAFKANGGWVHEVGEVKIAFVDSTLAMMSTYCRSTLKARVTVIRNLDEGKTCIFTAHGSSELIVPIMREVLMAEAAYSGTLADSLERRLGRFAKMAAEKRDGPLPGFEHWYVMFGGGMAFNGSLTHDTSATAITAEAFVYAVVNGVRIHFGKPRLA